MSDLGDTIVATFGSDDGFEIVGGKSDSELGDSVYYYALTGAFPNYDIVTYITLFMEELLIEHSHIFQAE